MSDTDAFSHSELTLHQAEERKRIICRVGKIHERDARGEEIRDSCRKHAGWHGSDGSVASSSESIHNHHLLTQSCQAHSCATLARPPTPSPKAILHAPSLTMKSWATPSSSSSRATKPPRTRYTTHYCTWRCTRKASDACRLS